MVPAGHSAYEDRSQTGGIENHESTTRLSGSEPLPYREESGLEPESHVPRRADTRSQATPAVVVETARIFFIEPIALKNRPDEIWAPATVPVRIVDPVPIAIRPDEIRPVAADQPEPEHARAPDSPPRQLPVPVRHSTAEQRALRRELEAGVVTPTPETATAPAGTAVAARATDSGAVHATATGTEEALLAVSINAQDTAQTALFIKGASGRLLARAEDLQRWRLQVPNVAPSLHAGERYYPLDALTGLTYTVDEARQTLALNAPPALFSGTVLKTSRGLTIPSLPPIGAFLNYDIFANHVQSETRGSGLLELGGFGRLGAGIGSFVVRDIGHEPRYIRLDTTFTHDRPAELASLRLGDAISRAGTWGRPIRLGGVQWATNFATQPGFVTFPLPTLAGEAVLPSTVDLYVNDALRLRREVPSGPFSIQDLPIVTGQGEARLVVRDLLGRERIITQPYYATPRLLQPGLHDYSYEVGFARRNYGIDSNDYGRVMAVGTHRLGFTPRFTGETHVELLEDQRTAGLAGAYLWPGAGLLSASLAASHGERGSGALIGAGFERQDRLFSFGMNTQLASDDFTQVGLQPSELAPKHTSQVFASLASRSWGSFGLSYIHQDYRDRADVRLASGSYNVNVGKATLGFSMLRFFNADNRFVFGLTLTVPFDSQTSGSLNATAQRGSDQVLAQVHRNLPSGTGFGYRVLAGVGDSERIEAGVAAQNDIGTYTLEAARANGETAVRASASGGVAVLGGNAFLTRRITDSFAVVQMPDYPNVRVYADNQLVAKTDADGRALVPRLRPYEKNAIRVEHADLPLDAQIEAVQVDAVPYFRSGMVLQFPVKRARGALLTVMVGDDEPLPAGAIAQLAGEAQEFPVGLRGEIYLSGLSSKNLVRIKWRDQACEFAVSFPDTEEPLPHLGTYTCNGLRP
jgi:outer membrane usher protein